MITVVLSFMLDCVYWKIMEVKLEEEYPFIKKFYK